MSSEKIFEIRKLTIPAGGTKITYVTGYAFKVITQNMPVGLQFKINNDDWSPVSSGRELRTMKEITQITFKNTTVQSLTFEFEIINGSTDNSTVTLDGSIISQDCTSITDLAVNVDDTLTDICAYNLNENYRLIQNTGGSTVWVGTNPSAILKKGVELLPKSTLEIRTPAAFKAICASGETSTISGVIG